MTPENLLLCIAHNLAVEYSDSQNAETLLSISNAQEIVEEFFDIKSLARRKVSVTASLGTKKGSALLKGFSFFISTNPHFLYDSSYLSSKIEPYFDAIRQARVHICLVATYITKYIDTILLLLNNGWKISFDDLYLIFIDDSELSCSINHKNIKQLCKLSESKICIRIFSDNGEQYSYVVGLCDNPFDDIV